MRKLLQNIPWPIEFAVIVAGAFGLLIVNSILLLLHPPVGAVHSEPGLWHMIGLQVITFVILGALLRLRGWTLDKMGLQSHWMDGLHGLALGVAAYFSFYLLMVAVSSVSPQLIDQAAKLAVMPKVMSPWTVAAVVLINSFYEEFFVSGYVISALKERVGETVAINASVLLRISYHLYQGVAVLGLIPVGLIFSYWYSRTNKLWPLIVAHAAINLVSLLPYMKS